jgi:hypothetical protein
LSSDQKQEQVGRSKAFFMLTWLHSAAVLDNTGMVDEPAVSFYILETTKHSSRVDATSSKQMVFIFFDA